MANELGYVKGGAMPWINDKESKGKQKIASEYIPYDDTYFGPRFKVLQKTQTNLFIPKYKDNGDEDYKVDTIRFNSIMSMIYNATNVHCISYHSLKGFVFIIECKENIQHIQLNLLTSLIPCVDEQQSKCVKPGENVPHIRIEKFILKMSFLTEKTISYMFNGCRKETDKQSDFVNEAQTQSNIFKDTYHYLPITYSTLDLSIIEPTDSGSTPNHMTLFLKMLQVKTNTKKDYSILSKIINLTQKNKDNMSMGLLSMEYGENYILYKDMKNNNENYKNVNTQILFNIMISFINHDIVHFDLHKSNIMRYKDEKDHEINRKNGIKPYVLFIDYGRSDTSTLSKKKDILESVKNGYTVGKLKYIQEIINNKNLKDAISMLFISIADYESLDLLFKDFKYNISYYYKLLLALIYCYYIIKTIIIIELDYYKTYFSKYHFQSYHVYKTIFNNEMFKYILNDTDKSNIESFFNDKIKEIFNNMTEKGKDNNFIKNDPLYHLLNYLYVYYTSTKKDRTDRKNDNDRIFKIFEKTISSEPNSEILQFDITDREKNSADEYYNDVDITNIPAELHKLRKAFLTEYLEQNPIST